jgi:hypothetical protein
VSYIVKTRKHTLSTHKTIGAALIAALDEVANAQDLGRLMALTIENARTGVKVAGVSTRRGGQ